ncbi:CBS domain-containing protein [Ectothiorhodospiraceae bacterium BW-2]|nr:CBS domain-containing protein [Ectothiorhodospiraceae bacterium BW-2]
MFAIYTTEGRRFRDTLEALYRVKKPRDATQNPQNVAELIERNQLKQRQNRMSDQAIASYKDAIKQPPREPVYHVYQIMSSPVISVKPTTSLEQTGELFQRHEIRQLPVMDVYHKLVGILTRHQCQRALLNRQLNGRGDWVEEIMTQEVVSADPITDIRRIVRIMLDYHLNALPVVDEQDELVGIVSRKDILRTVMNEPPLRLFA